jgi:glycolate oxidase iron-sulfur subunit
LSNRVRDVSEFLAEAGLSAPLGELAATVTYQDACHLAHGQRIRRQPRDLLRAIPGLTLVELPASDRCCGSAGIYNLTQPDISAAILRRKLDDVVSTGAPMVVAGNPGCLLQLQAGARGRGLALEAVHTVSLIAESCRRGAAREHSPDGASSPTVR